MGGGQSGTGTSTPVLHLRGRQAAAGGLCQAVDAGVCGHGCECGVSKDGVGVARDVWAWGE